MKSQVLRPFAPENFANERNWLLDVDDTMYTIECGLHDHVIKPGILTVYNEVAAQDPKKLQIVGRVEEIITAQGNSVTDPAQIQPDELGVAFPPIVRSLAEAYPDRLFDYLNRFYGDEYHRIEPSSAMVQAFKLAHDKGIGIYFYTNGPSSPKPGETSHLQKIMGRLGFDREKIETMRSKTYDLLMSIAAGRGKPTSEGMQDFLAFSGIDPRLALMVDDSPKNLIPAKGVGMSVIWAWTTDIAPKSSDIETAKNLGAPRIRDTGVALLKIAESFRP